MIMALITVDIFIHLNVVSLTFYIDSLIYYVNVYSYVYIVMYKL